MFTLGQHRFLVFALWLNEHEEQYGDEKGILRENAASKINNVEQTFLEKRGCVFVFGIKISLYGCVSVFWLLPAFNIKK